MRGAVSSGVFPIFGDSSSSSSSGGSWSFGSPDGSRSNWSCSKSRSSDSKAIYLSRDEDGIYSLGIRGASCPCSHGVDRTCSRSSHSCNAGAKVIPAAQLGVVVVAGGSSGSGHWMTSVAHEGHLDQLAETSQRRSSQELRCRCKRFSGVSVMKVGVCACTLRPPFFERPSIIRPYGWGQRGTLVHHPVMTRSCVLQSVTAVRFWAELHITSPWLAGTAVSITTRV